MADDLDLEEELLQVAGRARGAASRKRARNKRADSDDEDEQGSSEEYLGSEEEDSDDGGRSRKAAKKGKQGQRGRGAQEESEDEDEDDDGLGSDLFIDEDDKRKLMAMTELEREMILADRAEERDKARQRKEILKKAKEAEAEPRGQRQSSRQKKPTTEKESAIKRIEAARKRQEKGSKARKGKDGGARSARDWSESGEEDDEEDEDFDAEEEEEDARARRKGRGKAESESSEEGALSEEEAPRRAEEDEDHAVTRDLRRETYRGEDDMDVDEAAAGTQAAGAREGPGRVAPAAAAAAYDEDEEGAPADKEELRSIQLTRTQLEAFWDKPFFEGDGLNGAIVRMAYGGTVFNKETREQEAQYMLMQVLGIVTQSRAYPFGPRAAPCNKYLQLVDGAKIQRTMPMSNVSNQALKDGEIERYGRHCEKTKNTPISKRDVTEAKQRIHEAANYRWDAAKVKEVLERKRAAGAAPVNVAAEKSRLRRLLELAEAEGDSDAVAGLEAQLRDLEERKLAAGAGTQGGRTYGMSHINKRNQQANFNTAFKNVSNKPANAPERKGGADPFSRRATRPNIYWNTGGGGNNTAAAAAAEKEREKAKAASDVAQPRLKNQLARMDPAELVRVLDFELDLQPLQDFSIVPPLAKRLLGPRWHQSLSHHSQDLGGKTVLSIEDWKRRAGY